MSKNEAKNNAAEANTDSAVKVKYDPSTIELKWQSKWQQEDTYQPQLDSANSHSASKHNHTEAKNDNKKEKKSASPLASKRPHSGTPFYNLMMFPYPSAEGLHVGGIYTFGGIDVYGRFKRMMGYEVFEPIGLDGFGIHSENHAIKTNTHPIEHAKRTQENFYRQLHEIGNGFAWDNKVETYNPEYYRWTQWIFVQLFKSGLAYRKKSAVNFCPSCKTVLSDEQVIDGACERCGSVVEKRDLEQWFFKITDYAERLLENIETLDWSDKVRTAQRNWIGKKTGSEIVWEITDKDGKALGGDIITFTTRRDTIPGVTFLVLAPESQYVSQVTTDENKKAVEQYVADTTDSPQRQKLDRKKTGVFTGSYAKNPFNDAIVPIYVADYVLGGYGTGAVMGMPGHDERDREFAKLFEIPTILTTSLPQDFDKTAVYSGSGKQINSGKDYDGLPNKEAGEKIFDLLVKQNKAMESTQYHLRDWLISRQRYWGPPIPMIFCKSCADGGKSWFTTPHNKSDQTTTKIDHINDMAGWYPEENLPVELPYVKDFKPMGTGKAPLANYPEFYETTCPGCGKAARRETDVSDTFLDSAWYFLRYLATDLEHLPFPMPEEKAKEFPGVTKEEIEHAEKRRAWLPVTSYIGGAEHSVLHLLYARFVTMALHDMGYLDFEEPFSRFYAHGLIIKDGAKMSKSKGNVINPDEYIGKYGADTLRTYLLFLGPFSQGGDFRDSGIEGMRKFINRVWKLFQEAQSNGFETQPSPEGLKIMHETVKGVTEELDNIRFNTAIAKLMTWYNFLSKQEKISKEELETYLQLFAPLAPHMTEELWAELGNKFSIHTTSWPAFDDKHMVQDSITIAIQVNGKLRGTLSVSASEKDAKDSIEKQAREMNDVAKYLDGEVRKVIYIPGKILNFVVS